MEENTWIYKSLAEYARKKWILRLTAKQRLEKGKLLKLKAGKHSFIVDIKETLKYLISKL